MNKYLIVFYQDGDLRFFKDKESLKNFISIQMQEEQFDVENDICYDVETGKELKITSKVIIDIL